MTLQDDKSSSGKESRPTGPDHSGLDSYRYDPAQLQRDYDNKNQHANSAFTLTTCAISGLPLGWLPSRKLAFRGTIPFAQFSERDCLLAVECALHEADNTGPARRFAFFSLLFKLPPELLELRSVQLCPDWGSQRMKSLLSNRGLRTLAEFVETVSTIPSRVLELLPAFRISQGFAISNRDLAEFPQMLSRWVQLVESSKKEEHEWAQEKRREEGRIGEIRLFARRQKGARINIFHRDASSNEELTGMARALAQFYERPMTPQWEQFVRNPNSVSVKTLKGALDAVREKNVQEDDFSDELALSAAFLRWLEDHYLEAQAQQAANRRIMKLIDSADVHQLQGMQVENVQELLEKGREIEKAAGMPQRDNFKDLASFMDALAKWRSKTKLQERSMGTGR